MSRLLASLLISTSFAVALPAHAFGLPSVPGFGSKSSGDSTTDLSGSQDQLVKQYAAAGKSVLEGNAYMAEAVGLTEQAATARATGNSLGDGATQSALSTSDKTTSDSNVAIAAALKNTAQLDGPAKQKFGAGMVSLAKGLGQYIGMKPTVESFQKSLSSASPMMLPKLQSGSYIVTSLPSSVSNLSSALSNAISYAKSHDIPVPKEATDLL